MLRKRIITLLAITSLVLVGIGITKESNQVSAKTKVSINDKYEPIKQNITTIKYRSDLVIQSPLKKDFILTYYSSLAVENSKHGAVDCLSRPLIDGGIASNYYPLGSKININGITYEVRDKGSNRFNNPNRLDVFIPRNSGESNRQYYKRVQKMGVTKVEGLVLPN